ncbi:MAG TPA: hypothetical protein PKG52_00755 [bacterium]|nr:hypothetical protein [bacterium]HPS28970.1 hypothetical protein [bacterium]
MKNLTIAIIIFSSLFTVSCASKSGDSVDCPECDNMTEVLVGTKCVAIAEVDACGPDGHAHGTECHCFSNQEITVIGEKSFCLQQDCGNGDDSDKITEDVDAHACEAFEGEVAESVSAVGTIDEFDTVHVEQEELVEVTLAAGKDNFLHFEIPSTGDYALYLSAKDLFVKAYDENKVALETENMGANPDCPESFPQVYHILANAEGTMVPVILQFAKVDTDTKVKIFIHEAGHDNE